jgi:hypothetical protein
MCLSSSNEIDDEQRHNDDANDVEDAIHSEPSGIADRVGSY